MPPTLEARAMPMTMDLAKEEVTSSVLRGGERLLNELLQREREGVRGGERGGERGCYRERGRGGERGSERKRSLRVSWEG